MTTKGVQRYDRLAYASGDAFLFGSESRGLPGQVLERLPRERCMRLPMVQESRSLNLSNAVAIVIYEAWRQIGFQAGM